MDKFVAFCTLAAAVLRLAGVHFLFCFSAGSGHLDGAGGELPPFARWPLPFFASPAYIFILFLRWLLPFFASPACIFNLVFRRRYRFDGGGEEFVSFCTLAAAVLLLRRRAFLISFLRRLGHLDGGGDEFAAFCTLAAAVLCFAGVHF
ncbi:MAG: hypothetical protein ACLR23_18615 [Clostridia bacterium]